MQLAILLDEPRAQSFFSSQLGATIRPFLVLMPPKLAYAIACLPAIGQAHALTLLPAKSAIQEHLQRLGEALALVDEFYDSIGGLAGYQLQCLMQISEQQDAAASGAFANEHLPGQDPASEVELLVPSGLNVESEAAKEAVLAGIEGVPQMAEIYPLGGAGDRLGLQCEETGDSLPTAVLPYCGRSLLENLIRDLQAREYLYYRLYGKQCVTPVAVMTSAAKGNHARVHQLFEAARWFGRGRDAFRMFKQPLVPMVSGEDGKWLVTSPLQVMMKPGGHGAIWKLMLDRGVFSWLERSGRSAAIVRQISNPMAGQDTTLLALAGEGLRGDKAFGFASCPRAVGASEGVNVLLKETSTVEHSHATNGNGASSPASRTSFRISNVEYTEFKRLGIEDRADGGDGAFSLFPANTNVLYVGLRQAEQVVRQGVAAGSTEPVLPGMILNLQKEACYVDPATGVDRRVRAGRLECTMQNLADCFATKVAQGPDGSVLDPGALSTFMVQGPRRKVTSSAKRKRAPGSTSIHQTPDGSFLDLQRNAAEMLARCGVDLPLVGTVEQYLEHGPGFIFLFHPALGPLWDVVAQKIRGGRVAPRSEVQLEVAEVAIEGLDVDGSLVVLADSVMGHVEDAAAPGGDPQLVFSDRCGRVRLRNVAIRNAGVDWANPHNVFWRHRLARKESCRVVLHGSAEFEATDVELTGDLVFEVPDGFKMSVTAGADGRPLTSLEPIDGPSWRWEYVQEPGSLRVKLELEIAATA